MADTSIPLKISIAPFPEGFSGDMDETFQQGVQQMSATVQGNFLTGLVLPPGSTLPTGNVGPIAMGSTWYFWDTATNQYLPQSISARAARNYCKNSCYQILQLGNPGPPALVAGINRTYDMALCRMTAAGVLLIATDQGPPASSDYDYCPVAIKYTVSTTVPTLGAADIYAHEHLVEGADIQPIQGEILSLSFLCWVNQPGIYSAYLANGARDASYCTTFTMAAANTWTRIKIQGIPALPTTGTWSYGEGTTGLYIGVVMALGAQWQAPAANLNKWNSGFFGGTSGQVNFAAVNNNQMKITGMRLEASPQCGYAVVNPFDTDYFDCIRYYFTSFTYQSLTAGVPLLFVASATNAAYGSTLFPRRMCKLPTVVPYSSQSNAAGKVYDVVSGTDLTLANLPATLKGTGGIIAVTGTKGDVLAANFIADARLS